MACMWSGHDLHARHSLVTLATLALQVIPDPGARQGASCIFDFDGSTEPVTLPLSNRAAHARADGSGISTGRAAVGGGSLVLSATPLLYLGDPGLDYALLELPQRTQKDLKARGIDPLPVADPLIEPVRIGDSVVLVQHPEGRPREVSVDRVTDLRPPFLTYQCVTAVGSSGSPLFRFRCLSFFVT